MKKTAIVLIVSVLLGAGVTAQETGSLLDRLQGEVRALAGKADAALVELRVPGAVPLHTADRTLLIYLFSQVEPTSALGVLVGTPPVIVTSAEAMGNATKASFRLADGTRGSATLLGRDEELGVAVLSLPEKVAEGRRGLEVNDTAAVPRGSLALVPGHGLSDLYRALGLHPVRGSAPLGGWFRLEGLAESALTGVPAIGTDGRLIGVGSRYVGRVTDSATGWTTLLQDPTGAPFVRFRSPDLVVKPFYGKLAADFKGYVHIPPVQPNPPQKAGSFVSGAVIARVVTDLRQHGRIRHAYLGVVMGQTRGKGEECGVEIRTVLEGSPAEKAGLEAGARIRTVNGRNAPDANAVSRMLVQKRPGESLQLTLAGGTVVRVVLSDRAEASRRLLSPEDLGLQCVELGPELRSFLALSEETRGVVVRGIVPGSAAARAGVERGGVIVAADGEPIADLEELGAAVAGAKGKLILDVSSGVKIVKLTVEVPPARLGSKAR